MPRFYYFFLDDFDDDAKSSVTNRSGINNSATAQNGDIDALLSVSIHLLFLRPNSVIVLPAIICHKLPEVFAFFICLLHCLLQKLRIL